MLLKFFFSKFLPRICSPLNHIQYCSDLMFTEKHLFMHFKTLSMEWTRRQHSMGSVPLTNALYPIQHFSNVVFLPPSSENSFICTPQCQQRKINSTVEYVVVHRPRLLLLHLTFEDWSSILTLAWQKE